MRKVESKGLTKAQIKEKIRERYKGLSLDDAEVIPARKQRDFYDTDELQRVAVYVRVSTDNIQQTSSYELQKNYYEDMVRRHDNWTLVEIYADDTAIMGLNQNPVQTGVDLVLFFFLSALFSANEGVPA